MIWRSIKSTPWCFVWFYHNFFFVIVSLKPLKIWKKLKFFFKYSSLAPTKISNYTDDRFYNHPWLNRLCDRSPARTHTNNLAFTNVTTILCKISLTKNEVKCIVNVSEWWHENKIQLKLSVRMSLTSCMTMRLVTRTETTTITTKSEWRTYQKIAKTWISR